MRLRQKAKLKKRLRPLKKQSMKLKPLKNRLRLKTKHSTAER